MQRCRQRWWLGGQAWQARSIRGWQTGRYYLLLFAQMFAHFLVCTRGTTATRRVLVVLVVLVLSLLSLLLLLPSDT